MIIVNKYANYSANSIGHVDVPFEDETATAIMAKYTKTISSANRTAFAHLIADLKAAGLGSNIYSMLIPFLSANVTEAFTDTWRDVDSNYDASIHVGIYNGKYGTYVVFNDVDTTKKAPYVDTSGLTESAATLVSLCYASSANAQGPVSCDRSLWTGKSYITGGYPDWNILPAFSNLEIGENIFITSRTSNAVATASIKGSFNGVITDYEFTQEQITAARTMPLGRHAVSVFGGNLMTNQFLCQSAQTTISILFNKAFSDSEMQAVYNALHSFSQAIYENDIVSLMS